MERVLESLSSWDPTDLSTNHSPQSVQLTYFTHTHWSNNRLALGPNVNMAEPCSSFLQGAALSARPCSVRAFRVLGPNVNTTKPCNSAHEVVWRKLGPHVLIGVFIVFQCRPAGLKFQLLAIRKLECPFLVGLVRRLYSEAGRNKSAFPDRVQLLSHAKVEILIPRVRIEHTSQ
jgi:hypothetical protein